MKFLFEPEPWDFKNGLITYCAIRAQECDVGEMFFDYYDSEVCKYSIEVIDKLMEEGILTQEDKDNIINDRFSSRADPGLLDVADYIEQKYMRDDTPVVLSKLSEMIYCKVIQVYADIMSTIIDERYLKVYHLCFSYGYSEHEGDNYYHCCWVDGAMNDFSDEYYHAKNKNLLEEIG